MNCILMSINKSLALQVISSSIHQWIMCKKEFQVKESKTTVPNKLKIMNFMPHCVCITGKKKVLSNFMNSVSRKYMP